MILVSVKLFFTCVLTVELTELNDMDEGYENGNATLYRLLWVRIEELFGPLRQEQCLKSAGAVRGPLDCLVGQCFSFFSLSSVKG